MFVVIIISLGPHFFSFIYFYCLLCLVVDKYRRVSMRATALALILMRMSCVLGVEVTTSGQFNENLFLNSSVDGLWEASAFLASCILRGVLALRWSSKNVHGFKVGSGALTSPTSQSGGASSTSWRWWILRPGRFWSGNYERDGRRFLYRCRRGGADALWGAGHLQHRPGQPVHIAP